MEGQIVEHPLVVSVVKDLEASHLEEELKELAHGAHIVQRVLERQKRVEEEFGEVVALQRESTNQGKP